MTLNEKVHYEYERFYLDMMRTSKENIFAHSDEIEAKKMLKKAILNKIKNMNEDEVESLLVEDNLLESAYRFLKEARWDNEAESFHQIVSQWLAALLKTDEVFYFFYIPGSQGTAPDKMHAYFLRK